MIEFGVDIHLEALGKAAGQNQDEETARKGIQVAYREEMPYEEDAVPFVAHSGTLADSHVDSRDTEKLHLDSTIHQVRRVRSPFQDSRSFQSLIRTRLLSNARMERVNSLFLASF